MIRLNMEEEEDYKNIVEEFTTKSKDFLASKADETAAMMAKAQEVAAQRAAVRQATPKVTSDAVKMVKPEAETKEE